MFQQGDVGPEGFRCGKPFPVHFPALLLGRCKQFDVLAHAADELHPRGQSLDQGVVGVAAIDHGQDVLGQPLRIAFRAERLEHLHSAGREAVDLLGRLVVGQILHRRCGLGLLWRRGQLEAHRNAGRPQPHLLRRQVDDGMQAAQPPDEVGLEPRPQRIPQPGAGLDHPAPLGQSGVIQAHDDLALVTQIRGSMVEHTAEAGLGIPVAAGEGPEVSTPASGQAEHGQSGGHGTASSGRQQAQQDPEDTQEGALLGKGGTPPTGHGKPGLEEHGAATGL